MKRSNIKIKTRSFFNIGTQHALYETIGGYINKEFYMQEYIKILKERYKLDRIYRFDLGQNRDGCAEVIQQRFEELSHADIRQFLKNYPEFICLELRKKISELHNIFPEWVQLSAGLEQMLAHIASSFLEFNDRIMVTSPTFFLFEEFSRRMGAIAIHLYLREEDNFDWRGSVFDEYRKILSRLKPKLVWIANPNNPSGAYIPLELVKEIVLEAADHYAFVVLDEAYGEYTDPDGTVDSASAFLHECKNLIVLRTFSKGYGLANLRLGYGMTGNEDIMRALKIHSTNFPVSQLSFDFARVALEEIDYLRSVRQRVAKRKNYFIDKIRKFPHISFINSETNILMLRHIKLSAHKLMEHLERHGIIVARVPGEDVALQRYIRTTLGTREELDYMLDVLKKSS